MPGSNHSWYSYDWGDAHILVLDSEQPYGSGSAQYTFAQTDLAAHQGSAWRIVAIQRPPYSSTTANSSSAPVKQFLVPLFQSQHVNLVLSGNSHNYERTHPLIDGNPVTTGGITYLVSGARRQRVQRLPDGGAGIQRLPRVQLRGIRQGHRFAHRTRGRRHPGGHERRFRHGDNRATDRRQHATDGTDRVDRRPTRLNQRAADMDRGHRQRRRHRIPGVPQRRDGPNGHRHRLHRHRAEPKHQLQLHREGRGRRREPVTGQQHRHRNHHGGRGRHPPDGTDRVDRRPTRLNKCAAVMDRSHRQRRRHRIPGVPQRRRTVQTVTGTTYTDTGLNPNTSYSYTVKAVDAAGNQSPASNTATATTAAAGNAITLTPTNDATIDPATSSSTTSRIKVDDSSPVNDLLVKFVVPTTCTPTSAALLLTVGSGSNDASSRGGDFYATSSNDPNAGWAESTVTWATAPAKDPASPSVPLGAVAAGVTYSINVSGLVPATAGTTVTLRGSSTSADGAGYFSKEGSTTSGPQLRLTCG